ncbi:lysosomal acid lipase/cholesteryl ester hydrolase-like [Sceloporus undulatus]|uniref:lysosomal acid lipase/cholesteryl ester hydrolase-like n=1 Tax=Sceloporus undulatus TaxID=8520 RepID=UPI001C4A9B8D|nr:lysosomal acid lipase/cholesteryl ester hydrolase-like [Sceloporus undulatus]
MFMARNFGIPIEPTAKYTVDPECFLNVSEIIQYHGYPSEEHHVETEDGYILTIFRIPHGRYNFTNKGSKPTVFLQHCILGDASHWVSNQPSNSLGFILADAGYDVWLGNSRGNTYSSNHSTLKSSEKKFWKFSFHEMGYYDVPAAINFILNKTRQQQLYYVGHSEGTAMGFIAFSTWPKLAERIKVFFALGPVTTVTFATTPVVKLAQFSETMLYILFGNKGLLPYPTYLRRPIAKFCTHLPGLCANILSFICGYNIPNLNMSRLDVYATHFPAGTSVQNLLHWRQVRNTKLFQAYDYGSTEKNMEQHNQTAPPVYKIEDIKIPVAIWTGGHDFFVDSRDAAMLTSRIHNLIYEKHIPEWEHQDFIWGLDAPKRIYADIIQTMKKYLNFTAMRSSLFSYAYFL